MSAAHLARRTVAVGPNPTHAGAAAARGASFTTLLGTEDAFPTGCACAVGAAMTRRGARVIKSHWHLK